MKFKLLKIDSTPYDRAWGAGGDTLVAESVEEGIVGRFVLNPRWDRWIEVSGDQQDTISYSVEGRELYRMRLRLHRGGVGQGCSTEILSKELVGTLDRSVEQYFASLREEEERKYAVEQDRREKVDALREARRLREEKERKAPLTHRLVFPSL